MKGSHKEWQCGVRNTFAMESGAYIRRIGCLPSMGKCSWTWSCQSHLYRLFLSSGMCSMLWQKNFTQTASWSCAKSSRKHPSSKCLNNNCLHNMKNKSTRSILKGCRYNVFRIYQCPSAFVVDQYSDSLFVSYGSNYFRLKTRTIATLGRSKKRCFRR